MTNMNTNNTLTLVNPTQATAITHGGVFHADEVMATAIITLHDFICYPPTDEQVTKVARVFTVTPEMEMACDRIYDIGGGKFDHHQKGGNGTRENGVPYSSAGLIWKSCTGERICQSVADFANADLLWKQVDEVLISGIDAIDNGFKTIDGTVNVPVMSISQIISMMNPNWDSQESSDDCFVKAVCFARQILEETINSILSKLKAKSIVEDAISKADAGIMILDKFCPWQEYIFASENAKANTINYVIFPSNRGGYMVQCVPDALGSFGQRKSLPSNWRGLRDSDFATETGLADAIFCHNGGFCCSAQSLESAKKLAEMAQAK